MSKIISLLIPMLEGMQIDILKALVALCQASTKLNKMT